MRGAEAIFHAVNRFLSLKRGSSEFTLAVVDSSYAFNEMDRSLSLMLFLPIFLCTLPGSLSPMVALLGYTLIGRCYFLLLGFFSLGLYSIIQCIHVECDLSLMAWYLDNDT